MSKKRGNVTLILIWVMVIMLVLTAVLTRRASNHSNRVTLNDRTQVARYFLESYAGSIMYRIRAAINDKDKNAYCFNRFREAVSENEEKELSLEIIDCIDLPPELEEIKNMSDFEIASPTASASLCGTKLMSVDGLPYKYISNSQFTAANNDNFKEKEGILKLICSAEILGREYTLTVQYKYSVVFTCVPIIKDFMLYVSNMAENQDAGTNHDDINVVYTKEGTIGEYISESVKYKSGTKLQPIELLADLGVSNPAQTGMVYLGPEDKSISLNLAEKQEGDPDPGKFDDIRDFVKIFNFLGEGSEGGGSMLNNARDFVRPAFAVDDIKISENDINAYSMGFERGTNDFTHIISLGLVGFSEENSNLFKNLDGPINTRSHEAYFNKIEFYEKILKPQKELLLALSSGLRPLPPKAHFMRLIYGNVFSRFFVFTKWGLPTKTSFNAKPKLIIKDFDGNRETIDVDEGGYQEKKHYPFPCPNKVDYFYSRIISAEKYDPTKSERYNLIHFLPLNLPQVTEDNLDTIKSAKMEDFLLNSPKFRSADGKAVNKESGVNFDNLGEKFFGEEGTMFSRIGRIFKNQEEFEEAVGLNQDPPTCHIDGVVLVKGNLNQDKDLNIPIENIRGGIILCEGEITLKNITMGQEELIKTIDHKDSKWRDKAEAASNKWNSDSKHIIEQRRILTFVSLNKKTIKLQGNTFIGINLINLIPDGTIELPNIEDENDERFLFNGGIACNKLDFQKIMENFQLKSAFDKKKPIFLYPSSMANKEPYLAVQLPKKMYSYKLTAKKLEGNSSH